MLYSETSEVGARMRQGPQKKRWSHSDTTGGEEATSAEPTVFVVQDLLWYFFFFQTFTAWLSAMGRVFLARLCRAAWTGQSNRSNRIMDSPSCVRAAGKLFGSSRIAAFTGAVFL